MRLSRQRSSAVLSAAAAAALFSALPLVSAVPYARDDLHDAGYGYLVPQQCHGGYCGAVNDLCCGVDEACTTLDATPTCVHTTSNELEARQVSVWTTTWTETKTYTRTVSSQEQVATTAIVYEQCVPPSGSGQIACGNVCCGSWQYCAYEGQCLDSATAAAAGGTITSAASAYFTTTISGVLTTMYSAPYRVTSGASVTSTTTAANGTAIAATGGSSGLSGGAIAGIVIGVIAGVILLLLLCFCCLVRGAWGAVSGLFGGRKRRGSREKIVIEEERYVRHDVGAAASAHSRRSQHDSWYNGRPSAAAARKKESGKGLLGMAAGLGTLALLLGLKRDKHAKPAKSHRTRSSSASSDRRTRQSRGSRGTRTTRHTRTSRRSSRR